MSSEFLQQALNGLSLGATYALVAFAFALQFGVSRILNLALGELFTIGGFAAVWVVTVSSYGGLVALGGAAAAAMIVGAVIHLVAVRPLGDVTQADSQRHVGVLVATVGASVAIQNALLLLAGGYPRPVPALFLQGQTHVLDAVVPWALFFNLGAAGVLLAGLATALRHTRYGLRVRAIASNRELAVTSGIAASRYEFAVVLASSALAGIAGALTADTIGAISPFTGLSYGLKGLIVVVVGGPGNLGAAVLVAFALGVTETTAVALGWSELKDAIALAVLVVTLIIRGNARE